MSAEPSRLRPQRMSRATVGAEHRSAGRSRLLYSIDLGENMDNNHARYYTIVIRGAIGVIELREQDMKRFVIDIHTISPANLPANENRFRK